MAYPVFQTGTAEESYFGKTLKDPYRDLEFIEKANTKKWYEEQKIFYKGIMENISGRDELKRDIEKYVYSSNIKSDIPKESTKGLYYIKKFKKENFQSIFFRKTSQDVEEEIFSTRDLNKFGKNFHIDYIEPSYNGKYLAFGISVGGDEMSTIKIVDLQKKQMLEDSIQWAMYGNPQWLADESGFFYNQLTKSDGKVSFENSEVKLHVVGKNVDTDKLIFSRKLNTDLLLNEIDFPLLYVNPTSNSALIVIYRGSSTYATIYSGDISQLTTDAASVKWVKICSADEKVSEYSIYGNDVFVISYNENPYGILEKRNAKMLQERTKIFEGKGMVLSNLVLTKNSLYLKCLKNGINELLAISLDKFQPKFIKTPLRGTIEIRPSSGLQSTYLHSNGLYFMTCSWNTDWSIYKYENERIIKTTIQPSGKYSSAPQLIVKEIEVSSHDGALVPFTIIYSNKTKLDGKNPTILNGYGAYGIVKNPNFSYPLLSWYDRGGIYAVAHVRGGGEKGEDWYKGGFKSTKPNSWKDFIACAEYLILNKYTSSNYLAAEGGSAGGITVGRAITDRPELFKTAVITYGAVNSLRDEFTSNTFGKSEFGTIADPIEFNYLYEMDVYHHVKEDVNYPSVLLTAGINDPRVAFWQPSKVAAKMQAVSKGYNVVLLRISDEGHFGESSNSNDFADRYAFLLWQLGNPNFKLNQN